MLFFLPKQAEKILDLMKSEFGERVHSTSGITASNISRKEFFMHCEKCCKDDIEKYGETFWHRTHQLPGVFICYKHDIPLFSTNVSTKSPNQHEYINASYESVIRDGIKININEKDVPHLMLISKLSYQLLHGNFQQNKNTHLQNFYKKCLKEEGLCSPSGYVQREKVYNLFRTTFSNSLLEMIQSEVNLEGTNWLTMIFQKHRKSFHPLRHLLIIILFGKELNRYFYGKENYVPFGIGPWYCLNPVCPNYLTPVITDLKINSCHDTKRPVGTFTCNCGFVYSRRGPDTCLEDKYKLGRILKYGTIWNSTLEQMISEGRTLTSISEKLKCDPLTVKRKAVQLNIPIKWKVFSTKKNNNTPSGHHDNKLMKRRNEWLDFQEKYPELSKTELRKLCPSLFIYLYRHDRMWIDENSPKLKKNKPVNNRVNWEKRDDCILMQVKIIIQEWDNDKKKLTRISLHRIGIKLNKLSLLQKNGDKLPKTMAYINNCIENIEDFQLRRVRFLAQQMKINEESILEWKLIRKAGLRNNVSEKVIDLVRELSE